MRPKKEKIITFNPEHHYFSPLTSQHLITEEVSLEKEEFEAIRLKDLENLDQKTCSKQMNISQPTFHRLLKQARKKIALVLVKGHSLKIKI